MARFRFAEQDHKQYGSKWFEVDVFKPADIDAGVIETWEEATGYRLMGDYGQHLLDRSIKALRAMAWLAYLIGGGEIGWNDFKPQTHLLEWDGESQGEEQGPNRATRRAATRSAKASRSANTSKNTTSR